MAVWRSKALPLTASCLSPQFKLLAAACKKVVSDWQLGVGSCRVRLVYSSHNWLVTNCSNMAKKMMKNRISFSKFLLGLQLLYICSFSYECVVHRVSQVIRHLYEFGSHAYTMDAFITKINDKIVN